MKEKLNILAPIILFLLFYIIFSLVTYKDYGTTADEFTEYTAGSSLLEYFETPTSYQDTIVAEVTDNKWPDHTLPLISKYYRLYPAILNAINVKGYYEWFHLLNMFFASLIFIFIYFVLYFQYKNTLYAIIGPVVMFITPRFLGHIPSNPKDIPFAVLYFVALSAIYLLNKKQNINQLIYIITLGFLFGLAQSSRIIGFTLYPILFIYLLITKSRKLNLNLLLELFVIFIIASFVMSITWPYLAINFFKNLPEILIVSKNFSNWNGTILYFGKLLTREQRPWSYLFVWLAITTPLTVILYFVYSLISFLKLRKNNLYILMLITTVFNIIIYLVLKPIIYNASRHYLFITPVVVTLSIIGFVQFLDYRRNIVKPVLVITILYTLFLIFRMFNLYPYEYLYFNESIGGLKGAQNNFEMDYWGQTYNEAVANTLTYFKNDPNLKNLKVYPCNVSFAVLYYSKHEFPIINKSKDADITICDYDNDKKEGFTNKIISTVSREGVPLNIIRLKSL